MTAWLLWRIARGRGLSPTGAAGIAAAWAWSPCAILVTGYHCNTDPIFAFFCLLSVYLLQDLRKPFAGGAALAAAINIKLVPVLLIVPLLLTRRSWREAGRFVAGLSLGVLPFVPILLRVWPEFHRNAMAYNSSPARGGVNYFLIRWTFTPADQVRFAGGDVSYHPAFKYYYGARYIIFATIGVFAVAARWLWPRWNLYEIAAVVFALLLVFAPGFGVQYTVIPLALLFACRPKFAAVYGVVAGVFIGAAYWRYLTSDYPLYSEFFGLFPAPIGELGLLAWGMLLAFIVLTLIRPASSPALSSLADRECDTPRRPRGHRTASQTEPG
jgi:hypothetical protein